MVRETGSNRATSSDQIRVLNPLGQRQVCAWELWLLCRFGVGMIEVISGDGRANGIARIGAQPIALAAATLVVILVGVGSIVLWRAYTGTSPEQDRTPSARLLQVRTVQASEQLVEKTRSLEVSQQESIDQLQVVQDQLQTVRRLLTAKQAETKQLSEQ